MATVSIRKSPDGYPVMKFAVGLRSWNLNVQVPSNSNPNPRSERVKRPVTPWKNGKLSRQPVVPIPFRSEGKIK